ncbi:MAG: cytochrome c [Rhodospirillaceae bacterium]|jgi:mono/diheme cytochrome c family protein|nr:cytochrome c [Rhodospirillaceae bacterium]MBT5245113.1 cytochrome c [Rhodospirillaceae bacterium]MBT5562022.1 cytochrome c [Rhodospirillaceae bacterium]MBT6242195.1 cytochrome c [Rhodospirillaceae bacterium]MBT7136664.1 cytochrome c [Rhodospirillaceae bacterium]
MKTVISIMTGLALAGLSAGDAFADAAAGKATFEANKCTDCHYTDGPAKEKTIDDVLAKKGPELWYAGSKFNADWLGGWLADPQPIRLMAYNSLTDKNPGDHPKLAGGDAASVKDFLMSLTSADIEAGSVKPKKNPKGKLIFTKKMPCSGCHQYPDKKKGVKGGLSGPSLVEAGVRLNPDWILAYLKNPTVFKPVKDMPNFVGILSDKDMKNVSRHIASFKPKK